MAANYFWIESGEDGISIRQMTEAQLRKSLDGLVEDELTRTFLSKIPDMDKGSFYDVPENAAVIVKGEVIVPKAAKVVTRFEF